MLDLGYTRDGAAFIQSYDALPSSSLMLDPTLIKRDYSEATILVNVQPRESLIRSKYLH